MTNNEQSEVKERPVITEALRDFQLFILENHEFLTPALKGLHDRALYYGAEAPNDEEVQFLFWVNELHKELKNLPV